MDSMKTDARAAIVLTDPDGRQAALGDFAADPLVVILVRYFGCLPCQNFVRNVDLAIDRFPASARVIAVGGSTDAQARWLRETKGVGMPLLLDPEQRVRSLVGVGDLSPRQLASSRGWVNYAKAIGNGFRPQMPSEHARSAPGIAVFDPSFSVSWVHRGEMLGDYPTIDQLIEHVSE
jgi:peroxiredoxin